MLIMSRPKRIDLAFSLYHVLSGTNTGDVAFQDQKDRKKYLEYIQDRKDYRTEKRL